MKSWGAVVGVLVLVVGGLIGFGVDFDRGIRIFFLRV